MSAHAVLTGNTEEEWKNGTKGRYNKGGIKPAIRRYYGRYE